MGLWYRAERPYTSGAGRLRKGKVYTLTDAEYEALERDSEGTVRHLTAEERAEIDATAAAIRKATGQVWEPPGFEPYDPRYADHGRGPGDGVMHSGNMPGLRRG